MSERPTLPPRPEIQTAGPMGGDRQNLNTNSISLSGGMPPNLGDGCEYARIANALSRRDLMRLKQAQIHQRQLEAELVALKQRLSAISPARQITRSIQRLAGAFSLELRRLARRTGRVLWWTATLQLRSQLRRRAVLLQIQAEQGSPLLAPSRRIPAFQIGERPCSPVALVIDDHWPRPDRDSGSVDIVNLIDALLALNLHVIFAADREFSALTPYGEALAGKGVLCLQAANTPSILHFIEHEGNTIDLCVLARAYCGGRFLEAVQRNCMHARIVFDTIDLHFIRLEREARLNNSAEQLTIASEVREREEQIIRMADATIVVSSAERLMLTERLPDAYVVEMPLARPIHHPRTPFADRTGIGFVGGFAHAPNVDALKYFLAEIWPLVLRCLPDCEFSIVGADLPPELLQGAPGTVRYEGHVQDLEGWFDSIRLSIAPLRFGAGAKGKVASSLAAGVPAVVTSVAAEGMALLDGEYIMIGDTPAIFASHIYDIYTSPVLWARLSAAGSEYAVRHLSIAGWRERLRQMLYVLGVLPSCESTETPDQPK